MSHAEDAAIDRTSGTWADTYRDKWKWDTVTWGTHCVDCYPANCPYRVFVRDGRIVREEPAATFKTIEPGVPDMNPTGCQKGAAWSRMLNGKDRVTYPLRRAGERGEGRWKRVSWDEATTEIADAMLDAMEESGPRSILRPARPRGAFRRSPSRTTSFCVSGPRSRTLWPRSATLPPGCSSRSDATARVPATTIGFTPS